MQKCGGDETAALFGPRDHVAADRALTEFRAGRPVVFNAAGSAMLALPVDDLDDARLAAFRKLCAPASPSLLVSARRARALGLDASRAKSLSLTADANAEAINRLAWGWQAAVPGQAAPAAPPADAVITLCKLAEGLPAALTAPAVQSAELESGGVLTITAEAVEHYRLHLIDSLTIASDARVPLAHDGHVGHSRFVVFRDGAGGTAVAVVVGEPDFSRPVAVRLHSACLTGDVFGSRRCDCGEQLRLALDYLEADGGIVLYLPQEGRGLGIVNKMRAYALQDAGLDTIDANTRLGFDEDEREYGLGARMLELLGVRRIWLMTNNPAKRTGLSASGIEVVGRIPLEAPANAENRRYLAAKAMRAGHELEHFSAALAATAED